MPKAVLLSLQTLALGLAASVLLALCVDGAKYSGDLAEPVASATPAVGTRAGDLPGSPADLRELARQHGRGGAGWLLGRASEAGLDRSVQQKVSW